MNLHYPCLKVGQNEQLGVYEVVDPIRQTLQSQVTASHKLWTSVTIFCPQKVQKKIWCKFLRSMNFDGIVDVMKGHSSLDGFWKLKIMYRIFQMDHSQLTAHVECGRTMLTDLIYICNLNLQRMGFSMTVL